MLQDILAPLIVDLPPLLKGVIVASIITLLILLRYGLFTSVAFGISQLLARFAPSRRLQPQAYTRAQVQREIWHSMQSVLVFTGIVGVILVMTRFGLTQIYAEPGAYGWVWFWAQIPIALLVQDWYFYWMHRISHRPGLYERIHKTHHLSTNPSAFAAFAFHPLEALLEIGIFVVIVVAIPMTPLALMIVALISLAYNVYGHLGYEIMPRWLAKSTLGKALNKSAYHNQHHRTYKYNFGLYTTIWDRLHGTLHPKAEQLYDKATLGSQTPPHRTQSKSDEPLATDADHSARLWR